MENKIYDLIILGAGPAGLTAGLYAGRGNLDVLIIEKPQIGSLLMAHKIENYLGVLTKPTGKELYNIMKDHVLKYKVQFKETTFLGFDNYNENDYKIVKTDKENFNGKAVIIATDWAKNNSKKLPGEEKFIGAGVSYCATCDGAFTQDMVVSLIGKREELAEEALFLIKFAKKINIFITSEKLQCNKELFETLSLNKKVQIIYSSELLSIEGTDFVESLSIKHNNKIKNIETNFVFLYLGTKSSNELYSEVSKVDDKGYIITDDFMKTDIDGIYAAGDIRAKTVRQVTTATSDGTIAGMEAIKYILKKKKS